MNSPNLTIMRQARQQLAPYWALAVGITLLYSLITGIPGQLDESLVLLVLLISGPLQLGYALFCLNIARNNNPQFNNLFDGFKSFGNVLLSYILIALATLAGLLLFIVPGIIISLGLSMTFFILADDRSLTATEALKKSWELMNGHKMQLFGLILRFIPWYLLTIFTLFIGALFVIPWQNVALANFYDQLKKGTIGFNQEN
ncbi:MAG: DUF975 family protein [Flavobacteriaceae bacterium]